VAAVVDDRDIERHREERAALETFDGTSATAGGHTWHDTGPAGRRAGFAAARRWQRLGTEKAM
jgi:hypothetical protein